MTEFKMNPGIKAQWLEALRSGTYRRGTLCLQDGENRHCCLGVLCDLIDPNGWEPSPSEGEVAHHDGSLSYPSAAVNEKTGLSREQCSRIASENDGIGPEEDFTEIADWIEENL